MERKFLLILLALFTLSVSAEIVEIDGISYNPLSTASHLFLNDEEIHDLVIPDGVKTITSHAFYYFSGLTSVKIPSSVTSIGTECFAYCLGIKAIEIGDNASQEAATVLGMRAFYKCDNLNSVVLGNNIVEIGSHAFDGCN